VSIDPAGDVWAENNWIVIEAVVADENPGRLDLGSRPR